MVSAILLAAGRSRRMGQCKQLLPLGDKTVITRCIESILKAGISDIVVVVNENGCEIADAVSEYPVTVAKNLESESDMAGSVRVGLQKVDSYASGVIVALSDHPLVTSETYSILAESHCMEPDGIIIPVYNGNKGHPTLFPRPVLKKLDSPLTLRDLINRHSPRVLPTPVSDIGVAIDMDTREDYKKVLKTALTRQMQLDGLSRTEQ